eukprot:Selendium_serpulae@DN11145_c0_g1_i1.p1
MIRAVKECNIESKNVFLVCPGQMPCLRVCSILAFLIVIHESHSIGGLKRNHRQLLTFLSPHKPQVLSSRLNQKATVGDILAQKDEDIQLPKRKDMRFRSKIAEKGRNAEVSSISSISVDRGTAFFNEDLLGVRNVITDTSSMKELLLLVENVDRSAAFYHEALNMTILNRTTIDRCQGVLLGYTENEKSLRLWLIQDSGTYPPYADRMGFGGIEIQTPKFGLRSLAGMKPRIESLGGVVTQGREICYRAPLLQPNHFPEGDYFVGAHVTDPDGYFISLVETCETTSNWISKVKFFGEDLWSMNCFYNHLLGLRLQGRRINYDCTAYPFVDKNGWYEGSHDSQSLLWHYGDPQTEPTVEGLSHQSWSLWRNRGYEGMVVHTHNLTQALEFLNAHNHTAMTTPIDAIHGGDHLSPLRNEYFWKGRQEMYKWLQLSPEEKQDIMPTNDSGDEKHMVRLQDQKRIRAQKLRQMQDAFDKVDHDFFGAYYPEKLSGWMHGSPLPLSVNDESLPSYYKFAALSANTTKVGFWRDKDSYTVILVQSDLR